MSTTPARIQPHLTSYNGKNTATATWDKAAAFTPNGSAQARKPSP